MATASAVDELGIDGQDLAVEHHQVGRRIRGASLIGSAAAMVLGSEPTCKTEQQSSQGTCVSSWPDSPGAGILRVPWRTADWSVPATSTGGCISITEFAIHDKEILLFAGSDGYCAGRSPMLACGSRCAHSPKQEAGPALQ